jgi:hypothetical protein
VSDLVGNGGSMRETGIELIAAERQRQIAVEGWTPEHDDEHCIGEMIGAAVTYAAHALEIVSDGEVPGADTEGWWPWEDSWYKPSPDATRNLVKAGALIAAEIDRINRLASRSKEPKTGPCSVCGDSDGKGYCPIHNPEEPKGATE